MILQQLEEDDNKLLIPLKKCGRCRNVIEMFKTPIEGLTSYENAIYEILHNKDLVIKFEDFLVSCPSCGEQHKDITYIHLGSEDLELLNKTKLTDIWLTVSPN